MRITEDERDKVFEEFQKAEEKLLVAEEVATKVFISSVPFQVSPNCSFPLFLSLSVYRPSLHPVMHFAFLLFTAVDHKQTNKNCNNKTHSARG